jgi:hypothetical protein
LFIIPLDITEKDHLIRMVFFLTQRRNAMKMQREIPAGKVIGGKCGEEEG